MKNYLRSTGGTSGNLSPLIQAPAMSENHKAMRILVKRKTGRTKNLPATLASCAADGEIKAMKNQKR